MSKKWICAIIFAILLTVPGKTSSQTKPSISRSLHNVTIGNPAAVYCADIMAYEYKVVTDSEGGQNGVCILPDAQECDQWDFYAGLCGQEYNYCARQGHLTETHTDGQDPFAASYAVCTTSKAQVLGPVTQLSGLNSRVLDTHTEEYPDVTNTDTPLPPALHDVHTSTPSSFDWRNYLSNNWLTGIKNQKSCGSCWAFAAVGVAEAHYNIINDNPNLDLDLAEQELVSCSGAGSCDGGSASSAMNYIRTNGIVNENCLPYTASDSSCSRCSDWKNRLTYVDELFNFSPSRETIRQNVVDYGPIYTYMGIDSDYGGYFDGNGIYRCTKDSGINHAVVIVGYSDSGSYWIVRNSWGTSWNGDGYFKVGYNECGIDSTYAGFTYVVPPTQASNVRPDAWAGPYTNNATPRFQWDAASDDGSGMAGYYVAVDDWTPEGTSGNDWSIGNITAFAVPEALPDGEHIFAVTSIDRVGNINPTNTNRQGDAPYYTFYVDTVAPSSTVNALAAEQQSASFTVEWTGNDAISGIASYDVQYRFGTDGTWVTWISESSATSAVFKAQQEGVYYFRSRARDRSGNVESWPGEDGDAYASVTMGKICLYLPVVAHNYTYVPVDPYQPVGEITLLSEDIYDVRGIEEKDGYAYVLTREGYFYTYNVSDLATRSPLATYATPASTLKLANGNGLLRNGDYLYAFGYSGLTILSIQDPASPNIIASKNDLTIYNLVHHNDYLIAPGYQRVAIYSIADPTDPTLLSTYNAADRYFFSAAVYNDTLYTSEFEMFPGSTYSYGFRVFDFSDPSDPVLVRFISRGSAAYHLRILNDTLIECDTSFVGTWDLQTPTNPVFQTAQSASARACAIDHHNNLVTNGKVFRLNGNTLENIATFTPDFIQSSGFPYGVAVNSNFAFIAQFPRVLIIKIGPNPSSAAFARDRFNNNEENIQSEENDYQREGLIYGDTLPGSITP